MVRLVTAVIKPHRLEAVVDALQDTNVQGLTASEVRGFGRQGGHTETSVSYTHLTLPTIYSV